MAPTSSSVDAATRARHVLALAALVTAVGVLVAGTVARGVGGALVLAGWALGIYGLHTYGRLGRSRAPIAAIVPAPAPRASAREETEASAEAAPAAPREDDA